MFTTFLVTSDLSSFNIELQSGNEYVMSIIQDNEDNFITGGGFFRISASRATGFEDLFRMTDTPEAERPGYLSSQHANAFEQYAGSLTLAPLVPGDYDFDGDVDTFDYTKWRETFGSTTNFMADGNDDGAVNAADFVVWRNSFSAGAGNGSLAAVPEPGGSALCLMVAGAILCGRGRGIPAKRK